jgi:hypothetical protein
MGASQERAAFFNATLLVVMRHRGCIPAGRQAEGKFTLSSRFALFFIRIDISRVVAAEMKRVGPLGRAPSGTKVTSAGKV